MSVDTLIVDYSDLEATEPNFQGRQIHHYKMDFTTCKEKFLGSPKEITHKNKHQVKIEIDGSLQGDVENNLNSLDFQNYVLWSVAKEVDHVLDKNKGDLPSGDLEPQIKIKREERREEVEQMMKFIASLRQCDWIKKRLTKWVPE